MLCLNISGPFSDGRSEQKVSLTALGVMEMDTVDSIAMEKDIGHVGEKRWFVSRRVRMVRRGEIVPKWFKEGGMVNPVDISFLVSNDHLLLRPWLLSHDVVGRDPTRNPLLLQAFFGLLLLSTRPNVWHAFETDECLSDSLRSSGITTLISVQPCSPAPEADNLLQRSWQVMAQLSRRWVGAG